MSIYEVPEPPYLSLKYPLSPNIILVANSLLKFMIIIYYIYDVIDKMI